MFFDKGNQYSLLVMMWLGLNVQVAFSAADSNHRTDSIPPRTTHSNGVATFLSQLKTADRKISLQLGGFTANQGRSQNIYIDGLVGDRFAVNQPNDSNGLVGVGYYLNAQESNPLNLSYGVNAFYLAKTNVSGVVIQEQLFTNLGYYYSTTNYPIYFAAKALVKKKDDAPYNLTLDAGIGPNIITTGTVRETSLDGGVTIPDQTFSGRTTAAFSAMAGVGVRINHVFGQAPLECGYRFFYLGQGDFNKLTNQILNTLNAGTSYANALLCSITI
ncbi:hypothetical protein [Legionella maioricensis]|uniref:Type IX secretion system membrane protein PorP/SprF n=1 Tax=Legionella maioricensis TaxID=2896528 RepID=A0A9X2D2X9_9GAMM|nr:hypothetical protein [Legionella maioricensis]MCL9685705.1 hypothetical protein [Legionella maioricensis]MCL9689138.1 hypothetical protein [Legionella maioricensis]